MFRGIICPCYLVFTNVKLLQTGKTREFHFPFIVTLIFELQITNRETKYLEKRHIYVSILKA